MYKKFIKILVIALSLLMLAVGFAGCKEDGEKGGEPPTTYTLSALRKTIALDSEYQLSVVGLEEGETVVWASQNVSFATVTDDGLVKGVGVGQTTITARVNDQILECQIIVEIVLENFLEITLPGEVDEYINLAVGDEYTFAPELSGEVSQAVNFTISCDSSAVSISGLTVTAVSAAENVAITVSCDVIDVTPITIYVTIA